MAEGKGSATTGVTYDLKQLLGSSGRDFLVDSKGDKVSISEHLQGKTVGLFISARWWDPYSDIARDLADEYHEINDKEGGQFEVVFVPIDLEKADLDYRSKMPWLGVPYSDTDVRQRLKQQFTVEWKYEPVLVILQTEPGTTSATVINENAVDAVIQYGVEAFPFSEERIKEAQDAAKPSNTIADVLGARKRDYLLNKAGEKVPLSELEGKIVGSLFYHAKYNDCDEFLPALVQAYEDLKQRGEPFELVLLCTDIDQELYDSAVAAAPCPLALPFGDRRVKWLLRRWGIMYPKLVVLGPDGKTVRDNAAYLVHGLGADAYPFTPDKEEELREKERRQEELNEKQQRLESILVAGDLDYVVRNNGDKVPVRDLVGKTVLLYFSDYWCSHNDFTPRLATLVEMYNELKAQGKPVEVVFVSSDVEEHWYNKSLESMPWLAVPLSDRRRRPLRKLLEVDGNPKLVLLEPSGRTAAFDASELIEQHGAAAFPFTKARAKELEAWVEVGDQGWPELLELEDHEHELAKTKGKRFTCDLCDEHGRFWAFCCEECNFNVHTKCALQVAAGEVPGVLGLRTTDYLVNKAGEKVPLSELEGRVVGIFISSASGYHSDDFLPVLAKAYKDLKQRRVPFELVLLCTEYEYDTLAASPCPPAVPFHKKSMRSRLIRHFELDSVVLPTLAIVDPNGTKVNSNAVKLVESLGADAFPFTPDKEEELNEIQRKEEENQKLLEKDGAKDWPERVTIVDYDDELSGLNYGLPVDYRAVHPAGPPRPGTQAPWHPRGNVWRRELASPAQNLSSPMLPSEHEFD